MLDSQIPPERELFDRNLHVMITAELEGQIEAYMKAKGVKKAVAIRHMLRTFFAADFGKTKVNREETETPVTSF